MRLTSTQKGLAIIICLIIATAQYVFAETKYDLHYQDKTGKKINALQALIISGKGEIVYKCQTVESKASKSGTSISLRNVKKPKDVATK